jgi:hypothetical protein
MGVEVINSRKKINIDVVDTFDGNGELKKMVGEIQPEKLYEMFLNNITPVKEAVRTVHWMKSVEAAKLYKDKSLDVVFIDANHSYESVRDDIEAWLPKVKMGGIIAGHDYTLNWPGVLQAVNEKFMDIETHEQCWIHRN